MSPDATLSSFASIINDLLAGKRHSRSSIGKQTGKALSTVDRWLKLITQMKGVESKKQGRTTWVALRREGERPSQLATVGACIAASLAALFEGTENERNLKHARDYMLKARGVQYEDLDRKFVFAPRGGEFALPENAAFLDEIVGALLAPTTLRFSYVHNDGKREALVVCPLSLLVFDHQFYVLCRREDGSFYCYRFARMADVNATARSFSYPPKSEYEPRRVLDPGFGVHISGTTPVLDIRLQLREPWASFALKHQWHRSQQVSTVAEGVTELRLRVRHCPELETWLLGFGEYVTILQPSELRSAISARVAKMTASYATSAASPTVAKAKKAPKRPGEKLKRGVKSARPRAVDPRLDRKGSS